ncbi:8104_t:CDS:1, partial [Dentiscutata erythropus]
MLFFRQFIRRYADGRFKKGLSDRMSWIHFLAYDKGRGGLLTDLAKYKYPQTQKRNLGHDNTKKPFPSIEEIKKWDKERIVNFLESKKGELERECLIKETSKAEANDLVHVFVDNSNIAIEGKHTIGELENLGSFDYERDSRYFNQLRIDYGRLLTTVQCAP